MNSTDLFFGLFCIVLGASFGVYRIMHYPKRVKDQRGIFIPGIYPGSIEDKILYIGSPLAVLIGGIYFMLGRIVG